MLQGLEALLTRIVDMQGKPITKKSKRTIYVSWSEEALVARLVQVPRAHARLRTCPRDALRHMRLLHEKQVALRAQEHQQHVRTAD